MTACSNSTVLYSSRVVKYLMLKVQVLYAAAAFPLAPEGSVNLRQL